MILFVYIAVNRGHLQPSGQGGIVIDVMAGFYLTGPGGIISMD